jgi:hypothetical protein
MTTRTVKHENALQHLIGQLEDLAKQAGDHISGYLSEIRIRQRLSDAGDAIDDVRQAVLRRIRGGAAKPLEEMTVRELHELASEQQIPGRSSMSKADLIDALRAS